MMTGIMIANVTLTLPASSRRRRQAPTSRRGENFAASVRIGVDRSVRGLPASRCGERWRGNDAQLRLGRQRFAIAEQRARQRLDLLDADAGVVGRGLRSGAAFVDASQNGGEIL